MTFVPMTRKPDPNIRHRLAGRKCQYDVNDKIFSEETGRRYKKKLCGKPTGNKGANRLYCDQHHRAISGGIVDI